MPERRRGLALIFALLLCVATGSPLPVRAADALAYKMRIEGDLGRPLRRLIDQSSNLSGSTETIYSIAGLVRRTQADIARFEKVLRSEGYYDGTIRYDAKTDTDTPVITVTIEPGPVYQLDMFDVIYIPATDETVPADLPASRPALGISADAPARGALIVGTQSELLTRLRKSGYPFARVLDRDIVVDHHTDTMEIVLTVELGRRSRFGDVNVTGLSRTQKALVERIAPFKSGDLYSEDKLRDYKDAIEGLGVFSGVSVDHARHVGADGKLAVDVAVTERKPRTLGAGADYSTSDGLRGQVFQEHSNLRGRAERLRTAIAVSDPEQSVTSDFSIPHFRRANQNLFANLTFKSAARDAFDEESIVGSVGLSRKLSSHVTGRAGVEFDISRTKDGAAARDAQLLSIPVGFDRDTANDIFDPTAGTKSSLLVTPHAGRADETITFLRLESSLSAYRAFDKKSRFVIAGRFKLGILLAEDTGDLPADERFYAGGGGSVRAFAYQEAGPLDADRTPLGGRSVIEGGAELRWRLTEKYGLAAFVDAGGVFDEPYPSFTEDIFYGAGLGVRYFTPIGPVRFDIALPFDRRRSIDEAFQIYLGLGQAF